MTVYFICSITAVSYDDICDFQGHIQLEVLNIVPCVQLGNIVRLQLILRRYLVLLDIFLLVELLPVPGVLVDGNVQIVTDLAMQDVLL